MFTSQVYSPKLRLKLGEYSAFTEIGTPVVQRVLPSVVIPPPSENDPEKGRPLTPREMIHDSGQRLGRYWPGMPCLVDVRFLFGALQETEAETWLPQLFETAAHHNGMGTPIATLEDLERGRAAAFVKAGKIAKHGIAIRLALHDLDDFELGARLQRALSAISQRNDDAKPKSERMRDVCKRIAESDHFAGHSFSRGDAYIAECSAGNDGPGTASIWRKVNTVHHLTRVAVDIGALRGFSIPKLPRSAPIPQPDLFPTRG